MCYLLCADKPCKDCTPLTPLARGPMPMAWRRRQRLHAHLTSLVADLALTPNSLRIVIGDMEETSLTAAFGRKGSPPRQGAAHPPYFYGRLPNKAVLPPLCRWKRLPHQMRRPSFFASGAPPPPPLPPPPTTIFFSHHHLPSTCRLTTTLLVFRTRGE